MLHNKYAVFKIPILTGVALIAFAANSVICRLALGSGVIDAASFTVLRLLSGIVVLLAITIATTGFKNNNKRGGWTASLMLFIYAVSFSYAYISLTTGTGALILFGSVQITLILYSLTRGTRLQFLEWFGLAFSLLGFFYLVLPGATMPSIHGLLLMITSGVAWGFYTVLGKASVAPLLESTLNFSRTLPFVTLLIIFTMNHISYSWSGTLLALLSGGIMSGVGYTIWYIALGGLSFTQAAVVQLLVPIIAALGGVMFMSEEISFRLVISGAMVLGGVLMVTLAKSDLKGKQRETMCG